MGRGDVEIEAEKEKYANEKGLEKKAPKNEAKNTPSSPELSDLLAPFGVTEQQQPGHTRQSEPDTVSDYEACERARLQAFPVRDLAKRCEETKTMRGLFELE